MKGTHGASCSKDTRKYWKARLFFQRPSTTKRARTAKQCLTSSWSLSQTGDENYFSSEQRTTIRQRNRVRIKDSVGSTIKTNFAIPAEYIVATFLADDVPSRSPILKQLHRPCLSRQKLYMPWTICCQFNLPRCLHIGSGYYFA